MANVNGIVARVEQTTPEPSTAAEGAAAPELSRPPEEASRDSAGAPERYQDQFFAVLQELVSSGTKDNPMPHSLLGSRTDVMARCLLGSHTDVMARLLTLARRVDDGGNPALYRQAYLAALLWKSNPSTGRTVSTVIDDIEFSSSRNSPIYTVMYGLIASLLWLSLGALAFLTLSSFVYAWSSSSTWQAVISGPYFRLLTSPVMVASTFGMLGAVVSVLLRLSEFENAKRRSRQFLRMTGVVLPFVGAVFASVICALFASGLINFSFAVGSERTLLLDNTYFFIVIGFLSGFSERFARGLLGSTEKSLITTRSEAQTTLRTDDGATLNKVTQSTNVMKQQAPAA